MYGLRNDEPTGLNFETFDARVSGVCHRVGRIHGLCNAVVDVNTQSLSDLTTVNTSHFLNTMFDELTVGRISEPITVRHKYDRAMRPELLIQVRIDWCEKVLLRCV